MAWRPHGWWRCGGRYDSTPLGAVELGRKPNPVCCRSSYGPCGANLHRPMDVWSRNAIGQRLRIRIEQASFEIWAVHERSGLAALRGCDLWPACDASPWLGRSKPSRLRCDAFGIHYFRRSKPSYALEPIVAGRRARMNVRFPQQSRPPRVRRGSPIPDRPLATPSSRNLNDCFVGGSGRDLTRMLSGATPRITVVE